MKRIGIRLNRLSPLSGLKSLGIFVMGIWVIVLVGAAGSLIYQKFDGPTVQSVTAANLSLEDQNLDLNQQLEGSRSEIASLQSQLSISSDEATSLRNLLSRSSDELNTVLGRVEAIEKEGERLMKLANRLITVVPLELPPYDVKPTKQRP